MQDQQKDSQEKHKQQEHQEAELLEQGGHLQHQGLPDTLGSPLWGQRRTMESLAGRGDNNQLPPPPLQPFDFYYPLCPTA